MPNRVILIVLCIISLGWITYVGLDIYLKTDRLNPELVFSPKDQNLLIINRTDEFPSIKTQFEIPKEIVSLVEQFVETPRNERIFVSQTRPIILIESPNYWSENSVITYLDRKEIKYKKINDNIQIDDFVLRFKHHFLLIAPKDFKKGEGFEFDKLKWDKNATAVILQNIHQKDEKITEIYLHNNNQIVYQTRYKSSQKAQKIDDYRLFAAQLPANLENYHFLERNYAIEHQLISSKSPMLKWMNDGITQFTYEGTVVYMTDIKIGEDPINTFNILYGKDTTIFKENVAITQIALNTSFPSQLNKGFYYSKINDKAIFSENLDVNKKIIADYELGNTLLLHPENSSFIFGQLPEKVSERKIDNTDQYAVSSYKYLETRYIINNLTSGDIQQENKETYSENIATLVIPVEGKLIDAVGKGNQQYFLTSTNNFYTVNNGKIVWQSKIEGQLKGNIKIIDYEGTGKVYLLLNTERKIYLFNEQGLNLLDGIEIPNNILNEVNFYRWKNVPYLIFADSPNTIKLLSVDNKKSKSIKHTINGSLRKIEVFAQNNQVIGLLYNKDASATLNLENSKTLKKRGGISSDFIATKNNGNIEFIGFKDGSIMTLDYTGKEKIIEHYPEISKLKIIYIDNQSYITFVSYQVLHVYSSDYKKIASFNLPNNGIQDYDVCLINGNIVAGFIDGLENKAFITDVNNKIISPEVEAKDYIFLSNSKQILNLLTVGNVYAVQYYDILRK